LNRSRRGAANASSPHWERAFGLSAAGSLRPRRLGRKGEGSDLWALTEASLPIREAPGPSPCLHKLASSLRQAALSQWGEEAFVARASRSLHREMGESDPPFRERDPRPGLVYSTSGRVRVDVRALCDRPAFQAE